MVPSSRPVALLCVGDIHGSRFLKRNKHNPLDSPWCIGNNPTGMLRSKTAGPLPVIFVYQQQQQKGQVEIKNRISGTLSLQIERVLHSRCDTFQISRLSKGARTF